MRVGAAAVNYPDVLLVANQYQISIPPPFVVGSEFAGVVVEVGGETGGFTVGDRVTGTQMFGAFAEEIAVTPEGVGPNPRRHRRAHGGGVRGGTPNRVSRAALGGACAVLVTQSSCSERVAASDLPP